MTIIRVFCGHDEREAVGSYVFMSSVLRRSSQPVSFLPLHIPNLKGYAEEHKDGSNSFIYSRFLVPWISGYYGMAIFADGADMLCRADIAELWAYADPFMAVQVVKHDYISQHTRKYVGTKMEAPNDNYSRKNWSSLMIVNCAHRAWRQITPESIGNMTGPQLHRFTFIDERFIGELPHEWNHLVTEYPHNQNAKIAHFTLGVPAFKHYQYCPFASEWQDELRQVTKATD